MTDAGGTVTGQRTARRFGFYRRRVFAVLERLTHGTLTVRDNGSLTTFGAAAAG